MVLCIVLWGTCSASYYLEKQMYFYFLIVLLVAGSVGQYFAFDITERNWDMFKDGIGGFCTVTAESVQNGFLYSPWHELDNLYRYN